MSLIRDESCTKCPLHEGVTTVCIPTRRYGGKPTRIFFVGEAPGASEDEAGECFVGPAGDVLRAAISKFKIDEWPYAIGNTVRCRPPDNDKPLTSHVKACFPYLQDDVAKIKPQIIVPLGNVAAAAVLGKKVKITEWAGRVMNDVSPDYTVFPMLHPSAVLRYPEKWRATFEAHFQGLHRLCSGKTAAPTSYLRVSLADAIKRVHKIAKEKKTYAIDLETRPKRGMDERDAINPRFNEIVCASISTAQREAFWFEWDHGSRALTEAMMTLLESGASMVAHNTVFEVKNLLWHVVRPWLGLKKTRRFQWRIEDSLLFHYLLDENSSHALKPLAYKHTDRGGYDDAITAWLAEDPKHRRLWMAPIETLGDYNASDADCCLRLAALFRDKVMASAGLSRVWKEVLRPLVFSIAWMELHGRKVDFDIAETIRKQLQQEEDESLVRFKASKVYARYEADCKRENKKWVLNLNSAAQMRRLFFDYAQLPVLETSKKTGDPSTSAKLLEPFRERPMIDAYLRFKDARVTRNNYLEKQYLPLVAADGFLYGSYLPFGARTGRLSSVDPNLQNFTALLRKIIVARRAGWQITSSDWSQLELRLMAHFSGCAPLIEAFRKNIDAHALTASRFRTKKACRVVTIEEVLEQHEQAERANKPSWRQEDGKRPNFGCIYGAQEKRLSIEFGMSLSAAREMRDLFFDSYPEIDDYLQRTHAEVEQKGYVRSPMGRVRRLPEAQSRDFRIASHAKLQASNFPIQSYGNDLNTILHSRVAATLADVGMETVLFGMTHDSGDYDGPVEEQEDLARILLDTKAAVVKEFGAFLSVPLEIDFKRGPSWGELAKWKPVG